MIYSFIVNKISDVIYYNLAYFPSNVKKNARFRNVTVQPYVTFHGAGEQNTIIRDSCGSLFLSFIPAQFFGLLHAEGFKSAPVRTGGFRDLCQFFSFTAFSRLPSKY